MAKKPERKPNYLNGIFITGTARFFKIAELDTFNPQKPCYKTGIVVDAAERARVKKVLSDFGHKAFPDADLWLPLKKDKKNEDIFYFEAATRKKDEDTGEIKRPLVVDARLKPMSLASIRRIGSGSTITVKVTGMDYEGTKLTEGRPGVALLLETIQVKKLVEANNALAGFSADEDGYSDDGEQSIEHAEGGDDGSEGSGDAYDL